MTRRKTKKPTEAEMQILVVLWEKKAATVREIHELLNVGKPTAYTTTLKMLQNMTEKDLVERDDSNRAHVYRAKLGRETTERTFARDLIKRVFGGSASQLIIRVLESEPSDAEELAAIRQMIEKAERKVKGK